MNSGSKGNDIHEKFTPSEQRKKNALMRQFLKIDGPKGKTDAYRKGWDLAFTSECLMCGERIENRKLVNGECLGCRIWK